MPGKTYDLTKPGTPLDMAKVRSISVMGSGARERSRPKSGTDPRTGMRYQSVLDENNTTITEHSKPGTGYSVRQDVNIRPKPVNLVSSVG